MEVKGMKDENGKKKSKAKEMSQLEKNRPEASDEKPGCPPLRSSGQPSHALLA